MLTGRPVRKLGIEPVEPLWSLKTEHIIEDFMQAGFETIVACGNRDMIDKRFIGHKMDREFKEYLASKKLDVCGESGEFHTFVASGPLFQGKIEITSSNVTSRGRVLVSGHPGLQGVKITRKRQSVLWPKHS